MPYTEISDRETVSVLEYLHNDSNTTVSTLERTSFIIYYLKQLFYVIIMLIISNKLNSNNHNIKQITK
jgi:hypothetical protein